MTPRDHHFMTEGFLVDPTPKVSTVYSPKPFSRVLTSFLYNFQGLGHHLRLTGFSHLVHPWGSQWEARPHQVHLDTAWTNPYPWGTHHLHPSADPG